MSEELCGGVHRETVQQLSEDIYGKKDLENESNLYQTLIMKDGRKWKKDFPYLALAMLGSGMGL